MVVAICDDGYRANYPRDYLVAHHPVLVLQVNGDVVHFLLLCWMLCLEIFESATQFNREYSRFFDKPSMRGVRAFSLRVLRNSNWTVALESVFVAFTYGRKPALWVLATIFDLVYLQWRRLVGASSLCRCK